MILALKYHVLIIFLQHLKTYHNLLMIEILIVLIFNLNYL